MPTTRDDSTTLKVTVFFERGDSHQLVGFGCNLEHVENEIFVGVSTIVVAQTRASLAEPDDRQRVARAFWDQSSSLVWESMLSTARLMLSQTPLHQVSVPSEPPPPEFRETELELADDLDSADA